MEGSILNNRYEIINKIGSGGMADVYKAKCNILNRYVAIKVLKKELANDKTFIKRFHIEASAAAKLSHPNIVSIHDLGNDSSIYFIVMEYIDGITLNTYIKNKIYLNYDEAIEICIKICLGIENAHKNNIIHRDVKPQNIMITKDNHIKVTDFGIVKQLGEETLTMTGTTIGSAHYFSPEQAKGVKLDNRSDIYSIGIVLYHMVTGVLPFDGNSPVSIAIKHIQEKPKPPITINPNIPLGLNNIILKAISKNPENRHQSINELLTDLYKNVNNPNVGLTSKTEVAKTNEINTPNNTKNTQQGFYKTENLHVTNYKIDKSDNSMNKNNKSRLKPAKYIFIALAMLIFGMVALSIKSNLNTTKSDIFLVEDYSGIQYNKVKNELVNNYGWHEENLKYNESFYFGNKKIRQGIIIQNDHKDEKIKINSTELIFLVSNGIEGTKIPENILNINTTEAIKNLIIQRFKIKYKFVDEANKDILNIVRIEPKPGSIVAKRSNVTIYLNKKFDFTNLKKILEKFDIFI